MAPWDLPLDPPLDRFWQGRTNFGNQNQSGGTIFAAKIGPPGPVLWGTDFAVTGHPKITADKNAEKMG